MKIFKKIIRKLYLKYCSADIVSMTRLQLQGTTFERNPEDLKEEDRKYIAVQAKTVLHDDAFKLAVNNVKARVEAHIRNEAADAETIFFDRFTINGVALLEEELADYAEMIDDVNDKRFSKFSPL